MITRGLCFIIMFPPIHCSKKNKGNTEMKVEKHHSVMVQLVLPLKGAAFPGLSHFTPVPGFHQRTPVSDSIIRSFLGRFLTTPQRWIIVFALCAQHGTVPTVWRLLLYFCGLLFTCVFPAPSVDSPLVKPSTVPVPWSPPHDRVWFLSLHPLFPPGGVF